MVASVMTSVMNPVMLHLARLHLRLDRLVARQHRVGDAAVVVEVAVVQVQAEVREAGQRSHGAGNGTRSGGRAAEVDRRAKKPQFGIKLGLKIYDWQYL